MTSPESENAGVSYEPPPGPSGGKVLLILGGMFGAIALVISGLVLLVVMAVNDYRAEQERVAAEVREQQAAEIQAAQKLAEERRAERDRQLVKERRQQEEIRKAQQKAQEEREEKIRADKIARFAERAAQEAEARRRQEMLKRESQLRANMTRLQDTLCRVTRHNDPTSTFFPRPKSGHQLSWRVHLLPSLGQKNLYERFHLDEPWDSDHNRTLIKRMPSFYGPGENGRTGIRSFLRLDGPPDRMTRTANITDGVLDTMLLLHVPENHHIEWTRPDSSDPLTDQTFQDITAQQDDQKLCFSLCVRSVSYAIENDISAATLKAWATPNGGEHVGHSLAETRLSTAPSPINEPVPAKQKDVLNKLEQVGQAVAEFRQSLKLEESAQGLRESPLSWRVHILPFIGEEDLYHQFNLKEDWDSETNLPLVNRMPGVFHTGATGGRTRLLLWNQNPSRKHPLAVDPAVELKAPAELTLAVYFAAPQYAVTWTKREGSRDGDLYEAFGWLPSQSFCAATFSGTAYEIPANLHATKRAALTNIGSKQPFNMDEALSSPKDTLRIRPFVGPPAKVAGLIEIPEDDFDPKTAVDPPPDSINLQVRKMATAIHEYQLRIPRPPLASTSPSGPSGLSWRVRILPYLGHASLFAKFNIDEPWDSPHNVALLDSMPDVYRTSPNQNSKTCFQVLTSKDSFFFSSKRGIEPPDGINNTIMILHVDEALQKEWTRPDDNTPDLNLTFAKFAGNDGVLPVCLGDGSCMQLGDGTTQELFAALATGNGREIVDAGTVRRWQFHKQGQHFAPAQLGDGWVNQQLRTIAMAFMNYGMNHRVYPPATSLRPAVLPLRATQLSWRVHLLPFLNHEPLYRQFRLEEPWDSPHNKQLLRHMPDVYRDFDDDAHSTTTRILVATGPGTLFPEIGRAPSQRELDRDMSRKAAFFEVSPDSAVPWTKPADYEIDLTAEDHSKAVKKLYRPLGIRFARFDGAIQFIPPDTPPETVQMMIQSDRAARFRAKARFE